MKLMPFSDPIMLACNKRWDTTWRHNFIWHNKILARIDFPVMVFEAARRR